LSEILQILFRTTIAAWDYTDNDPNSIGEKKRMKYLPSKILKMFLLVSLLTLVGCNAPLTSTPTSVPSATAVPTLDPQILASTVSAARTEAVGTAFAQLTEAVTATPLSTDTPLPTETPTVTPVTPTVTRTFMPFFTQTTTALPAQSTAYQCEITDLAPKYGESLTNGADFDLAVTLKNIGTKEWTTDNIDFKYLSGDKFQKKVDAIDLPSNVSTDDSIKLVVDMVASTGTGTKDASWGLVNGTANFCTVSIHVIVK
jgi:hypothetical protein